MDFFVHDNIYTYNKRFPFNGNDVTRINVNQIYLPEGDKGFTGAFWFETDHDRPEHNVNLNKKYLHLHKNMPQIEKMQFDKDPYEVLRTHLKYNPDTKSVEISKPKSFFRKDILFTKKALYYGAKLPERIMNIIGDIIYDNSEESMHFILNYLPQKIKFHMEDEEEPATMEQLMRVEELEEQIAKEEAKIAST